MDKQRTSRLFLVLLTVGFYFLAMDASYADHANRMHKPGKKGPWIYNLVIKSSPHHKFSKKGKTLVRGAHVPSLVEHKDTVAVFFQWFPSEEKYKNDFDHIAYSIRSRAGENWSIPAAVKFLNVPETVFGTRTRPMDPAAVVLADGRIRLFFTLEPFGPSERVAGDAQIHSAISSDGKTFVYDDGVRFAVSNTDLRDPAVAYFKDVWHMYVPNQKHKGTGFYATSSDGLTFTRQNDVRVNKRGDWLGHATVCRGKMYFFGTVWRGVSSNGRKWRGFDSIGTGADPAVICLAGGSWIAAISEKNKD